MSEYVKDPSGPEGWKVIAYDKGETRRSKAPDTVNLNADTLHEDRDEGMSEGMSDVDPDVRIWPHKI